MTPEALDPQLTDRSYLAKQLIVLGADILLRAVDVEEPGPTAERLVRERVLPDCYLGHYDRAFLEIFHNTLEVTRNLLVSDIPFVVNTLGELAAHAIFAQDRRIIRERGHSWLLEAAEVDPSLPDALLTQPGELCEELEAIEDLALEDAAVLTLFDVPPDQAPDEHLRPGHVLADLSFLRFENWLVPFGNPPRPRIAPDGRAWPG